MNALKQAIRMGTKNIKLVEYIAVQAVEHNDLKTALFLFKAAASMGSPTASKMLDKLLGIVAEHPELDGLIGEQRISEAPKTQEQSYMVNIDHAAARSWKKMLSAFLSADSYAEMQATIERYAQLKNHKTIELMRKLRDDQAPQVKVLFVRNYAWLVEVNTDATYRRKTS